MLEGVPKAVRTRLQFLSMAGQLLADCTEQGDSFEGEVHKTGRVRIFRVVRGPDVLIWGYVGKRDDPDDGWCDIQMNETSIVAGNTVSITSMTVTMPEPKAAYVDELAPECDECFGTGLTGGFQGRCSEGCEINV